MATAVDIENNINVQPGWIYLRKKDKFYPPKNSRKLGTRDGEYHFRVREIDYDSLKEEDKFWKDEIKGLKDQAYKMIYCVVSKRKRVTELHKRNINFEYATEVNYMYGIMMMVKINPGCKLTLKDIQFIFNRKWGEDFVNAGIWDRFINNIKSVTIYDETTQNIIPKTVSAARAVSEVVRYLYAKYSNNKLESVSAILNKLPSSAENESEAVCAVLDSDMENSENLSIIQKIGIGVQRFFWGHSENGNSEKRSTIQNLICQFENISKGKLYQFKCKPEFKDPQSCQSQCKHEFKDPRKISKKDGNEGTSDNISSTETSDRSVLLLELGDPKKSSQHAVRENLIHSRTEKTSIKPDNGKFSQSDIEKFNKSDSEKDQKRIVDKTMPEPGYSIIKQNVKNNSNVDVRKRKPVEEGNSKNPDCKKHNTAASKALKTDIKCPIKSNGYERSQEFNCTVAERNSFSDHCKQVKKEIKPLNGSKSKISSESGVATLNHNLPINTDSGASEELVSRLKPAGNKDSSASQELVTPFKQPVSKDSITSEEPVTHPKLLVNKDLSAAEEPATLSTLLPFKKITEMKKDMRKCADKIVLEEPSLSVDVAGFKHNFYHCLDSDADEERKTLLLLGSEIRGKASLLNLLWHCSHKVDKEDISDIVDYILDIESISFYHLGLSNLEFKELVVISTPKLTGSICESIKKYLIEGVFNIHAIGFVVDSRSETLTSEERSFFSFLRSSFGEVSNHHLMTFLTYCDLSTNFPILDEMKHQSINAKNILEFNNAVVKSTNEFNDLGAALFSRDKKKAKKIYKVLREMPLLSVKSTKINQEKFFAVSYLDNASKQLVEELEKFIRSVDSGEDFTDIVKPIWKLSRLVLAMRENKCTENELLEFIGKSIVNISLSSKSGDQLGRYFLLLVFSYLYSNIACSIRPIIKYFSQLFCTGNVDPESMDIPLSASVLYTDDANQMATFFCSSCKNVHLCYRDFRDESCLTFKCPSCSCHSNDHTLWTFNDSINLSSNFYECALEALNDVYNDLPKLPFNVDFRLFFKILIELYPCLCPLKNAVAHSGEK